MAVYNGVADEWGKHLAAAGAAEMGAHVLQQMTAKATLYVRLKGVDFVDTSGSSTNEDVMALRALVAKRNKSSEKLAGSAGSSVSSMTLAMNATMQSMTEAELSMAMLSKGFIPVEVQYNPSSLRFNTIAGKIRSYTALGPENMNRYSTTERKASTTLIVQLLFDSMNISDSFGATSMGTSVDTVTDLAKEAYSLAGDGLSVKTPVEGLISLLMTKYTRQVIFCWNNLFFHGELNMVSANFTMFNKTGHPVRATVDLQIKQNDANATFVSDKQYWDDAFDRASQ
ncbi:MAG: hypothetical protein K6G07_00740 [Lachnospiraceae bacterium]|nr:hypothetical protein [Lachnospiraceae bacterium]